MSAINIVNSCAHVASRLKRDRPTQCADRIPKEELARARAGCATNDGSQGSEAKHKARSDEEQSATPRGPGNCPLHLPSAILGHIQQPAAVVSGDKKAGMAGSKSRKGATATTQVRLSAMRKKRGREKRSVTFDNRSETNEQVAVFNSSASITKSALRIPSAAATRHLPAWCSSRAAFADASDLALRDAVHLEIQLAACSVLRVLTILAHHDDGSLNGSEHGQEQI